MSGCRVIRMLEVREEGEMEWLQQVGEGDELSKKPCREDHVQNVSSLLYHSRAVVAGQDKEVKEKEEAGRVDLEERESGLVIIPET